MIAIVVAHASNGVIGRDGGLPWHLPSDLKRFRELTSGHTVVMGRRTYESIPDRFRPLPNRRNLVLSRVGRSLVAVRDNETAAEVSGVPVAQVKIVTFGISSALAGIGGSLFALNLTQVNPSSFTIVASIYFLIAVVVGGAASIVGPAIGALIYGVFTDVVAQEFPDRLSGAQPVVLGVLLIVMMLTAPGGVVGVYRTVQARLAGRRARAARRAAA